MSQPVKLSDGLVMEARVAGKVMERSIAGQVEFWASLGKRAESILRGKDVKALRNTESARLVEEGLASVGKAAGKKRMEEFLSSRPLPHFLPHPTLEDAVIRVNGDGSRSEGRLQGRVFVPLARKRAKREVLAARLRPAVDSAVAKKVLPNRKTA